MNGRQPIGGEQDPAGAGETSSADGEAHQPVVSAYGKALAMLSRREHSRRELERKLGRSGVAADAASSVLEQLQQQSFQSDERFAQLLVRSRVSRGQGPRRILAELRTHGIADEQARLVLDAEAEDWLALAQRIYRRRYGAMASRDPLETRKRAAFLLRRGFDAATVRAITHADDVDDSAEEFD
ncbi:MAG: regulatory protein RecX [Rhodanobacteraceae bacterium]|nr:regulatory protein RecX [Rhodanobacteraceae bacterium]